VNNIQGPKCYPVVGASLFIKTLGKTANLAFTKLGELYGPVTGIHNGRFKAIIINGYEATKEFYTKDDFPHRPNLFSFTYRWGGRQLGVFFSNGRLWQEQRRFTLRHLRDFGFGKTSMEGLIHEECEECINSISKAMKLAKDSVISVHDKFGVSVLNILWAIMAGVRYKHDDENFKKMLKTIQDSFRAGNPGSGNLVSTYPFLRHFPYFKQQFKLLTAGSDAICDMIEV
jgi:methyl farnesoate epoxidase/farnesoate epoxidase